MSWCSSALLKRKVNFLSSESSIFPTFLALFSKFTSDPFFFAPGIETNFLVDCLLTFKLIGITGCCDVL